MATAKIYFDTCPFIEVAKGHFGQPQTQERAVEAAACRSLLDAARKGEITIITSALTLAEAVHVGQNPVPEDVRKYFARLILSGRDGVLVADPSPFIVERARDMAWDHGILGRAMDRIHLATALETACVEFISVDGKLAQRVAPGLFPEIKIVSAASSSMLPDRRETPDMFTHISKAGDDD